MYLYKNIPYTLFNFSPLQKVLAKLDLSFEHLLFQITWLLVINLINLCLLLSYVLKMPVLKSVEHHYFGEILVYVKLRYVAHRSGKTKPSNSYCFVYFIVVKQETQRTL